MGVIPDSTIKVLRKYNDLTIQNYGIDCTLYVPTNLTSLEGNDLYTVNTDISYKQYSNQKVWIDWSTKQFDRLRKLGIFNEGDLPIIAFFKNFPEVLIHSYIVVPIKYIPEIYDTDSFEIVNVIALNTYNNEVVRSFKLAPKRDKV
jgi:hypothetical protein